MDRRCRGHADLPIGSLHTGEAAPTACFDVDQGVFPERVISWDFEMPQAQSPSLSLLGVAVLAALVLSTALWVIGRRIGQRRM